MVTLLVDGEAEKIGTLRQFWKVTEIDTELAAEIDAVKASLHEKAAPVAAMVVKVGELPLANEPDRAIGVHLVLGWDEDRASVTDVDWDYLPVLGYVVKTADATAYTLHEERDGLLHPMSRSRAVELGVLDVAGRLVRRGQPLIVKCRSVKPYIALYAQADCLLSDGRAVQILTSIIGDDLPAPAWYAGKRPADVAAYSADEAARKGLS
jgi:hypothetical protein